MGLIFYFRILISVLPMLLPMQGLADLYRMGREGQAWTGRERYILLGYQPILNIPYRLLSIAMEGGLGGVVKEVVTVRDPLKLTEERYVIL